MKSTTINLAPGFDVPIDVVTESISIIGRRGSGKTVTANRLAEGMLDAGQQVVFLDPTNASWGLRSSADGKRDGYAIPIFGGQRGDIPLEDTMGRALADALIETRSSAVVCVRDFSKTGARRFVGDFAEQLYERKCEGQFRTPLHLFLDEADAFCMSADTEILTVEGWRSHAQVEAGALVAAYDPAADAASWEPIQRVIRRSFSGEMVKLKTKSLDCLVTPDHRVVLSRFQHSKERFKWYPWEFRSADSLPVGFRIPSVRPLPQGRGIDGLDARTCRILGWLLTDGYVHDRRKSKALGIEQSLGTVKVGRAIAEEMGAELRALGATCYERAPRETTAPQGPIEGSAAHVWYIPEGPSLELLQWLGGDLALKTERCIPRRLLEEANREQLEALRMGLLEGDGTSRGDQWTSFYPGINEGLADDFQELCSRLGLSSTKSFVPTNQQWHVHLGKRADHHLRRATREEYSGLVWDITVEGGAFLARRNGRVFITGNCPQRIQKGGERAYGAIDTIVRRGRIDGFGTSLISQRPAVIAKDVLTQTEVLVCHQVTGPHDQKALLAWMEEHGTDEQRKEFLATLASLKKGEAWFWSPAWLETFRRVQVRMRSTWNSSQTPKVGEKLLEPEHMAAVDLEEIRKHLAPKPTASKAGKGKRGPAPPLDVSSIDSAELEGLRAENQRLRADLAAMSGIEHEKALDCLGRAHQELEKAMEWLSWKAAGERAGLVPTLAQATSPRAPERRETPAKTAGRLLPNAAQQLTKCARGLLIAILQNGEQTLEQAAICAGYSPTSGSVSNAAGELRAKGLVDGSNTSGMRATAAGKAAIPNVPPIQSGAELLAYWQSKLEKCPREMLGVIVKAYPKALSLQVAAEKCGYSPTSGSVSNAAGRLRTLALVIGGNSAMTANGRLVR